MEKLLSSSTLVQEMSIQTKIVFNLFLMHLLFRFPALPEDLLAQFHLLFS